ncbi:hypothetical protein GCM10010331_44990 [Streptomyces xanthochromogenes]|nr:hypothetical protein GCM10010331_44990 [Streptomyces xanthochromogenes]
MPCANANSPEGPSARGYSHQWLCEVQEDIRCNYPVRLRRGEKICPKCGGSMLEKAPYNAWDLLHSEPSNPDQYVCQKLMCQWRGTPTVL